MNRPYVRADWFITRRARSRMHEYEIIRYN